MAITTGIKEVRKHNTQQFIDDFRHIYSFGVWTKWNGFYEIKKKDIWKRAQSDEIVYELTDKIYVSKRTTMIIL